MFRTKHAKGSGCSMKAEIGLCVIIFLMTQNVKTCENKYPVEEKKLVLHPLMNGFLFIKRSGDTRRDSRHQRPRTLLKVEDIDGDYPVEQVSVEFNFSNYMN